MHIHQENWKEESATQSIRGNNFKCVQFYEEGRREWNNNNLNQGQKRVSQATGFTGIK